MKKLAVGLALLLPVLGFFEVHKSVGTVPAFVLFQSGAGNTVEAGAVAAENDPKIDRQPSASRNFPGSLRRNGLCRHSVLQFVAA